MSAAANILDDLTGLYHSYRLFGVENQQVSEVYAKNQLCKERILLAYIQYAIAKCKKRLDTPVSFAELFCADGYYAMSAHRMGADRVMGLDNNREGHLATGREIARRLRIPCQFIEDEAENMKRLGEVDIVANVGGLYHVGNPMQLLRKSYECCTKYLIVQSVVSLACEGEDYFESPAPGWDWGCRFSRRSFDKMIRGLGYEIVDRHFNELEGNARLEDRGSVYYLIEKGGGHE
jgi:hypothetical protein